ncbi:hypothetical protein KA005_52175 [bacterium]|nr:hypothetical protein [bacterium]
MKYKYTIEGVFSHESTTGEFTEGQVSGSAILYDTYNEITDPVNPYDEWDIFSYQFMTGTYVFEGVNGVIKRFINSNTLYLNGPESQSWGESEDIYITHTGPGAIPPEKMSYSKPDPSKFEMSDGTFIHIDGLVFSNREIVREPCTLRMLIICLFSFIRNWWR